MEIEIPADLFIRISNNHLKSCQKYLWNEEKSVFFDYDIKKEKQSDYEACTTFWALWAGIATPEQAEKLVHKALSLFEVAGGIVSSTEKKSRGDKFVCLFKRKDEQNNNN